MHHVIHLNAIYPIIMLNLHNANGLNKSKGRMKSKYLCTVYVNNATSKSTFH